jgi:hypothetical protein
MIELAMISWAHQNLINSFACYNFNELNLHVDQIIMKLGAVTILCPVSMDHMIGNLLISIIV